MRLCHHHLCRHSLVNYARMSYGRPTQSKAQTESNAKILRALVKQPDNKVCVDCKRNDPRWASWNLGCFLCIRCSGIHRSMGTHISKVKSIDLDIWTPEQMASVQKWGNRRSNLYWEAHLKAGHVPPDHKVESFIRSKYELRRWAKDGPMPDDPSVLDGGAPAASAPSSSTPSSSSKPTSPTNARAAAPTSALDLLGGDAAPGAPTTSVSRPSNKNLLDDDFGAPAVAATAGSNGSASRAPPAVAKSSSAKAPAAATTTTGGGGGGLFDLDWHDGPAASPAATSPTSATSGGAKGKNDILSLFAAKPAPAPAPASMSPQQQARALGSFSGSGLDASFGNLSMGGSAAPASTATNPWSSGQQQQSANMFGGASDPWASASGGADVWGNATTTTTSTSSAPGTAGKNDAFADIWSDFK